MRDLIDDILASAGLFVIAGALTFFWIATP